MLSSGHDMATEIMISQQLRWPEQEDQANQNFSIDEAEDLQETEEPLGDGT